MKECFVVFEPRTEMTFLGHLIEFDDEGCPTVS